MTRHLPAFSAALCIVFVVPSCIDPPADQTAESVATALTATGVGGATYRLPPGATLFLKNGKHSRELCLDTDSPSEGRRLPPGDYRVSLFDDGGDMMVWPLTRYNLDGTTEIVLATLDLAKRITVVAHQTTNLVIRFHVGSDKTDLRSRVDVSSRGKSHKGNLDVSMEVDEAVASVDLSLAVSPLTVASIGSGPTTPSALPLRLPALGDHGDGYTVTSQTTGPWVILSPNLVCAPVKASAVGSGNQGFVELVSEGSATSSANVCIAQNDAEHATINVSFSYQGPATTPLLSDLGDRQFFIDHGITADVEAAVFDGTTLDLQALEGTRPAAMNVFGNIAAQVGDGIDGWYQVNEFGDGTLSLATH